MRKQNSFKLISLCLTLLLLVAAVFSGCANKDREKEGEKCTFTFSVVFEDGSTKSQEITTTKEFVGAALENDGLIEGEMSQYGLTVHTVCGETVEFGKDQKYWAVYIDGDYALSGIDSIKCSEIEKVEFKVESY